MREARAIGPGRPQLAMTLPPTLQSPTDKARRQRAADLWRRISSQGNRCYYPAAAVLLLVATILRFYDLWSKPPGTDEYVVAAVGIGTFAQFFVNLHNDSVPIIHPLLLWVLQDVATTAFSIRAISAAASVLAIAGLLLLLPRLGVARWAAFLAAALLTVSAPGLEYARRAEEYSLDTLVAVLMTAGLLLYLRTGRKGLLCVTLFLGPLVLYGLALFGAAVLATAGIAHRCREEAGGGGPATAEVSWQARVWGWLRQRRDWFWPAAALLAGSAATWLLSLRYQWVPGGWGNDAGGGSYLASYYFDPEDPLIETLPFAVSRLWDLLSWQLSYIAAALGIIAFGIILLSSVRRRQFHPLLILALFAFGIAVAFSLLSFYPLGNIRQTIYLGPIIVLAAGLGFWGTASQLAAGLRREWLRPALLAGLTLVCLLAGAQAVREYGVYAEYSRYHDDTVALYTALAGELRPDDAVYNRYGIDNRAAFYYRENPMHYRLWRCFSETIAGCGEETVKTVFKDLPAAQRIWFKTGASMREEVQLQRAVLREWAEEGKVEHIALVPRRAVWLVRDIGWIKERWAALREEHQAIIAGGAPLARADFDLYLREGVLHFHRKPCTWGSTTRKVIIPERYRYARGSFFVKLTPLDPRELPPESRAAGYESADLDFTRDGFIFEDYCWGSIPLPEYDYPLAALSAGQHIDLGPPVWEHTIDLKRDYFRAAGQELDAAELTAAAFFDLYLKDDALYYYRERCAAADTEARFFLHFVPWRSQICPRSSKDMGLTTGILILTSAEQSLTAGVWRGSAGPTILSPQSAPGSSAMRENRLG